MKEIIFNDVTLAVIDRDGQQWLSTLDIAKALYPYKEGYKGGYQSEAPFEKRVRNLYSRHKEEFTNKMTSLIDVQTAGGIQKMRVFSLRGAHLLAMLARSERAKQFRRWVLDLIERHENEIGLLTTEYHQALVAYELGKQTASIHGKGLSNWKSSKQTFKERIKRIQRQIQPDLFITAQ